ncbi:MAG TPA: hypothetical protein VE262_07105 [Blastocatellia bacterium]|nr:hypothetical protein [Blastocatellia bacterium]
MAEATSFNTSATTVSGSGFTGGTVPTSGPYKSGGSIPIIVFFKKGQKFTAGADGRSTSWTITGGSFSSGSVSSSSEEM